MLAEHLGEVPTAGAAGPLDRRDGLRRRIYVTLLTVGIPSLLGVWAGRRLEDPLVAWSYPLLALSQLGVLVGLVRRRMAVRTAEQVVLLGLVVVFLAEIARQVWTAEETVAVHVSSLLSLNLMTMLAYVAHETRQALRVSLGIVGAYVGIIAVRLLPEVLAGGGGQDAAEYVSIAMFMLTSVGLLHVLAQTKEQAAEARSSAAALQALANTDVLTGIANRRRLHDALEEALAQPGPVSVVLVDVDRFKRINDTHGHSMGDEVLHQVAVTIEAVAGPHGLVGRWGGEEFLVLIRDGDHEGARAVAEACRGAVADLDLPLVGTVTCSLGVAVSAPGDTAWTLLRRADEALYGAKHAGRDRVVVQSSRR